MKRTFTLISAFLISISTFADSGGPDDWGYTWKDSNEPGGPVYNWFDIQSYPLATEVKLLADDNLRGPFNLNFNFHYYWYDVNQFWVGSNGYIKFNELGQLAAPFPTIPTVDNPNDYIGAYMNDLIFGADGDTGQCWYWLNPNLDTMIISWINVPFWDANPPGYSGSNTFQVILSAVDSSITFQYKDRSGSSPFGTCTSTGFENGSGHIGLQVLPYCTEPPTGYAIKIYPPTNPTLQVEDVEPYYVDNPVSGAIFLPESNDSYPISAEIKNDGNVQVNAVPVYMEIKDPDGNIVVTDTAYTGTIEAAESQLVNFFLELTPNVLGTYRYVKITTGLSDDEVGGNDVRKWEVIVVDTTQSDLRLSYDDGNTTQITQVNWAGTGGGAGMYFIPPYYPCEITKIHYYMYSGAGVPMAARVWDDDGIGGLPFTEFDSIYVDPGSITDLAWNDFTLSTPIVINSGGFYVSWNMLGPGQLLGSSTKPPFSNRSFEVFDDAFSTYRFGEAQDPMINATIEPYSFATGVSDPSSSTIQAAVSPNPASENVYAMYKVANQGENVWLRLYDLSGKKLVEKNLGIPSGSTQQTLIDISDLTSGVYLTEISCGGEKKLNKLVIR